MAECPYRIKPAYTAEMCERVYDRMLELMPGWFEKMAELMDPYEPNQSVRLIASIAIKNPGKPLDDIIHEEMEESWFWCHEDYDKDW